ncbi:uncharacterized protein LOC121989156 [Zingiber officinale]|uniref:uncharacterized protein LOC121989156 n=1 Tax=Zingiber officinale TaxID=94328 RepID=UPI001C4CCF86|nr:uncharacterized protein LOC121989156 [Zingiber officinale]
MVPYKAVAFNRFLRGSLREFPLCSVFSSNATRTVTFRVSDPSFPFLPSPRSVSFISDAASVDSVTEVSKSGSLSSLFAKPKPRPVSVVAVPSKHDAGSKKEKKPTPLTSSVQHRVFEQKEWPKELPKEVVALVERLREKGYLKLETYSRMTSLSTKEVPVPPANMYSRQYVKSAAEKYGQDQQEIAKWLSGSHLKKVALYGCPSVERKTVFASKRLRSFFSIQEDVVCRGCKIRDHCKFANLRVSKEEKVILSDTMRILALWAFDAVPRQLSVSYDFKSSVYKLLEEVLNLSDDGT